MNAKQIKKNKTSKSTKLTARMKSEADAKYLLLREGIRKYVWKKLGGRNRNFTDDAEQSAQVYAYETILSLARKNRLHDAYASNASGFVIQYATDANFTQNVRTQNAADTSTIITDLATAFKFSACSGLPPPAAGAIAANSSV